MIWRDKCCLKKDFVLLPRRNWLKFMCALQNGLIILLYIMIFFAIARISGGKINAKYNERVDPTSEEATLTRSWLQNFIWQHRGKNYAPMLITENMTDLFPYSSLSHHLFMWSSYHSRHNWKEKQYRLHYVNYLYISPIVCSKFCLIVV